jgi:hypothetical protein
VFARARQLESFLGVLRRVVMKIHIERDALLIFFQNRHCKTEAHNREIYWRAVDGER